VDALFKSLHLSPQGHMEGDWSVSREDALNENGLIRRLLSQYSEITDSDYNSYNGFPRFSELNETMISGKCRLYLNVTNTMPHSDLIFELFRNFTKQDLSKISKEELDDQISLATRGFFNKNAGILLKAKLILFDGEFRARQIDINFNVPALYDTRQPYSINIDRGNATDLLMQDVFVPFIGEILETKAAEVKSWVDLRFKFPQINERKLF